jgi:hypothetical protein
MVRDIVLAIALPHREALNAQQKSFATMRFLCTVKNRWKNVGGEFEKAWFAENPSAV